MTALNALVSQTLLSSDPGELVELSAFDDGSTDGTWESLLTWAPRLAKAGMRVVLSKSGADTGSGCGNAKNRAVAVSSGEWLCFQDVDDMSLPTRLATQLTEARLHPNSLIGSRVVRTPEGSTARYTTWANSMTSEQLVLHRFRECTILMPTWFLHREAFEACSGFRVEKCEDLLFLQGHVVRGGGLHRCDEVLVEYRYHAAAATHAIPRQTILRHRAAAIERAIELADIRIWGAGRDGRDFFKALSDDARKRVRAFCDVDPKKVGTTYQILTSMCQLCTSRTRARRLSRASRSTARTAALEANLASLGLKEGVDYYLFG